MGHFLTTLRLLKKRAQKEECLEKKGILALTLVLFKGL